MIIDISQNPNKSTGPRTDEGKKISSQNAVKHHLFTQIAFLPAELREEFDALHQGFIEDLKPHGTLEDCLVRRIAEAQWRLSRIPNLETKAILKAEEAGENCDKPLNNYGMYSQRITREIETNLKTLHTQQEKRLIEHGQHYRMASLLREHYKRKNIDWDPAEMGFVFSKELLDKQIYFNQEWDKFMEHFILHTTTKYQDELYAKEAL